MAAHLLHSLATAILSSSVCLFITAFFPSSCPKREQITTTSTMDPLHTVTVHNTVAAPCICTLAVKDRRQGTSNAANIVNVTLRCDFSPHPERAEWTQQRTSHLRTLLHRFTSFLYRPPDRIVPGLFHKYSTPAGLRPLPCASRCWWWWWWYVSASRSPPDVFLSSCRRPTRRGPVKTVAAQTTVLDREGTAFKLPRPLCFHSLEGSWRKWNLTALRLPVEPFTIKSMRMFYFSQYRFKTSFVRLKLWCEETWF